MACRWLWVAALVFAMGTASAADTVVSFLGHEGPVAEPGATPSVLGWGPDDQAYPEQFAVNPVDLAEMVWVPAGTFQMGSTQEEIDGQWAENDWYSRTREADAEKPQHQVTISKGFWLYKHEVTIGQYAQFLAATGHAPHDRWDEYRAYEHLPVNNVTWDDCTAYAAWAQGALPTEAQWEWSARGPEGRIYPWGNTWDRMKCLNLEGLDVRPSVMVGPDRLCDVGSFASGASWCGARDLAGSMWEWCADWYGAYSAGSAADPQGPDLGTYRALHGGSYQDNGDRCRSAGRYGVGPPYGDFIVGFRLARAL